MQFYKLKGNYEDFYDLAELLAKKVAYSSSSKSYGVYEQLRIDYLERLIRRFLFAFTDESIVKEVFIEVEKNGVELLHKVLNLLITEVGIEDYAIVLNELTTQYGIPLTFKSIGKIKNQNSPSVFMSHSSDDKPFVRKIANRLISDDIKVWLDEAEIKVGESLIQKIGDSIFEMDFLIVVLSQNSINSNWIKKELDIAISLEVKSNKLKILPIIIDSCSLPLSLLGKLYLDFTQPQLYQINYEKLLSAIQKDGNPIFLTAREAVQIAQSQLQRTGSLVAISQQGISQRYVSVTKRGDWLMADAKTGRSRVWILEYLDEIYNVLRPFAITDNTVVDYPVINITPEGVIKEPKLNFLYIDSDIAINNAIVKAIEIGTIDSNSLDYYILTTLKFYEYFKEFTWCVGFYDITLNEPIEEIYINSKTGKVITNVNN